MSHLIDPDEFVDELEEMNAAFPPAWEPEPMPDITERPIASTDYDEELPF